MARQKLSVSVLGRWDPESTWPNVMVAMESLSPAIEVHVSEDVSALVVRLA